jgi:hypothetical protein
MKIIVAGIIGRYPYGGVAWCSLMYLLGLRRLGHEVWYLEDTGECNYDPLQNAIATDPTYALAFIDRCLAPYGFGDRWCYVDYQGNHHGHSRDAWRRVCADADLYLVLSGGSWFWRDEYRRIPHSAFIDSDPGFTQLAIAKGVPWYVDHFARFGALFTFGSNIGTAASPIPVGSFEWQHTWQPVSLTEWSVPNESPRPCFTTVMTWKIESFEDIDGNKDREFAALVDLPSRTDAQLELAINGPHEMLSRHGWRCRDAYAVSSDLGRYRDYLRTSFAEWSVAKHTYVRSNTGWFSDRTECYLASGRPTVVQETGFSTHLPTGAGLFAYETADEALAAIEDVRARYAHHARAAREIAAAHFADDVVLPSLIERAVAVPSRGAATAP